MNKKISGALTEEYFWLARELFHKDTQYYRPVESREITVLVG